MAKIFKAGDPAMAGCVTSGRGADTQVHGAAVRARELLDAAEAEAAQLRAETTAERARVLSEAREQGRQEGLALATETVARAQVVRERMRAAAEDASIPLALALARKVLGRELALDRTAVVELAARALAEVRDRREVILRINPIDAVELRTERRRLEELLPRAPWLELREDEGVAPGGVVVETEAGVVDARLDAQLAALERALREVEA